MLWEMLSFEGLKWSSLEWQNCPQVPHVCQGSVPCSTGRGGSLSLFPSWKPGQCQIFRPPIQPSPRLLCTHGGFVTLSHIFGGCPAGTTQLLPSPTPVGASLCSEPWNRSSHTLPWSRTSSSSSGLSSVVNPSRWEAAGQDSSCISPLLFTHCFD